MEHGGEADDVGVFELAEPGLGFGLGAVGGHDLGDRPHAIDRHQLVAQDVVGRMQADGQVHLWQLLDHAVHAGHHA